MTLAFSGSPSLKTIVVESSALAQVAYDLQRQILQVWFRDGAIYQYLDVPLSAYQDLLRADSKGGFFNQHIRRPYACTILRRAAPDPERPGADPNEGVPS